MDKFSPSSTQGQCYHSPQRQCRAQTDLCRPSVQAVVRVKSLV